MTQVFAMRRELRRQRPEVFRLAWLRIGEQRWIASGLSGRTGCAASPKIRQVLETLRVTSKAIVKHPNPVLHDPALLDPPTPWSLTARTSCPGRREWESRLAATNGGCLIDRTLPAMFVKVTTSGLLIEIRVVHFVSAMATTS